MVTSNEANQATLDGQSQKHLPQTDESSDKAAAVAGLSIMGMLLGLLGVKRKKREDD
ncbi:extracellular protein, LPXTG-motif cell wall anchor [Secundilactobacillus oryzae JCM 18671]|uniref:Extracellular protein, LPXTG-motif cell wall anchor n=1 Tax=Secundilactobacillus oryzae JCM 18671 TaxID=1291743 RepID=A0A081BGT8_9LACO|nr:LPXTG cell wall anchor domain-containing protein [Secundilactobacillus oryzae]GAK47256.1 extracellular protein, LPXTG-motif cell wall anchor [Secundilactobacillus oryzae JCM 18671]